MESAVQHKISPPAQLMIALGWYFFLFGVSAMGNESDTKGMFDDGKYVTIMKMAQGLIVFLVFIAPVLVFSLMARSEKIGFLNIHKAPSLIPFITALTICVIALPAVGGMQQWNAALSLPESMSGLEQWMKAKEEAADEITKAFFVDKSTKGLVINLVVIAFMAALSEEIFFRGLLQRLFQDNKMNLHLAVWLTAILFSAFHLQFFGFLPRVFLGAILGYLYAFTGNLWVSITAHFANNAFAVIMSHVYDQAVDTTLPGEMEGQVSLPLTLLSIVLVGGQLWFIASYKSKVKS